MQAPLTQFWLTKAPKDLGLDQIQPWPLARCALLELLVDPRKHLHIIQGFIQWYYRGLGNLDE
jgi:hypothetical protein